MYYRYHDGWWWGPGVLVMIAFLVLIGVGVWAIVRFASRGPAASGAAHVPSPRPRDPALEEIRLRYARGEIGRDEFVQRSRDLGGPMPEPGGGEPPAPTGEAPPG